MKRSTCLPLIGLLSILLFAGNFIDAQEERRERRGGPGGGPPWMQGGPPGGGPPWMQGGSGGGPGGAPWMQGGPGGRGGDRRDSRDRGGNDTERNERMLGMLRSMDTNRNGVLEPNEIPEYRRSFVNMVVTRMGGDPNRRIDLNALARSISRGTSSQSQRPTAASSSSASQYSVSNDPLVPYFGEKSTDSTPIVAFGQKEPEAKTAATAPRTTAPALSQSDQILRSAREIMNRYDKNKNGTLDKDKGEWVSSLPFKPDSADTNRDGRVSMTELIATLGGKSGATSGAAAVSTRQSIAYERIPPGMPDWFFARDKDQDGQLSMMEYANDQPWTPAIVEEFEFLDRNNDGVATAQEIFTALKEFDEKKKLKEELAKREIERRKGAAAEAPKEGEKPTEPPKDGEKKPDQTPPGSPGPPKDGEKLPEPKPPAKSEPGSIPTTGPYATESDSDRRRRSGEGGQRGSRRGGYRR